jgi:hypothetical protein
MLVWSGHAVPNATGVGMTLITHETDEPITSFNSVLPENLAGDLVECRADQILLIFDTCYSGQAVLPALEALGLKLKAHSYPAGRRPWIGVLASSLGTQPAEDGLLAARLIKLLRDGPETEIGRARWAVNNEGIRGMDLIDALITEWPYPDQTPESWTNVVSAGDFFPNPLAKAGGAEHLVADVVSTSPGGEPSLPSDDFTGRREVLAKILDWLRNSQHGVLAIVGSAGIGKSAVLDRVAALSNPALSKESETARQVSDALNHGGTTILLRARGQTLAGLLTDICRQLGIQPATTPDELLPELRRRDHPVTRLLDGLDAASNGQAFEIATKLIRPLASVARWIVTTRDITLAAT